MKSVKDFSNDRGNYMKTFLLKAKHFFKRNIYPITVTMCTVLVLAIIAVSAYSAIKSGNEEVSINTNGPVDSGNQNIGDGEAGGNPGSDTPTSNPETIIFDLPFDGAKITKAYAENGLLYDATTDYWRSHQALDFACKEGQEVKAVYAGTIDKIESTMMEGLVIHLKITDELEVVYKGLSTDAKVKEGDKVSKGQVIGTVSLMLSEKKDGIHLHLEMLKSGVLIDPTDYFAFNK